jgi:hypothetical protein
LWSLSGVNNLGEEVSLTDDQKNSVQLQNDGSVNIDVGSDYSVLGMVWTLKLKATSIDST